VGDDFSRLVLLLIAGAAFVNITRGTFRAWLHNKAIGG